MEDNPNERQPKWKMAQMEDDSKWNMTQMEYDPKGRTQMEDDLNGR